MYLTDRKNDVHRQLSDHEELELLLETFSKQVEEMVNEAENIHVRVGLTFIGAPRLTHVCRQGKRPVDPRDSWAYTWFESECLAGTWSKGEENHSTDHFSLNVTSVLKVSIGTMGIGMGALMAGLFGMNVSVFVFTHLPVPPSYGLAFSLPVTWRSTHTPLRVCPSHRVSLHFSLHGLVFEGPFFDSTKSISLMDITPF
jgi:hypothetical protein